MPTPHIVRLLLPAVVAVASLGGCISSGGAGPSADPPVPVTGTRTTVEFGPDAVVTAEILRIGDDARATVRAPTRLIGEEVLVGDDHYVLVPESELFLGEERWIHTDLSDPGQRRYHEANPAGFIDLADLADLRVGESFAGQEVLEVHEPGPASRFIDLGEGRTIDVVTEPVTDPDPIVPPEAADVVALPDLPSLVELPSMLDEE